MPDLPAPDLCDVLVIGGGPAGSTAAALLAERGRDVVLLEKETHPRFHIGESLLPRNLELFERLGLRDVVAAMGVLKPGAEFVSDEHRTSVAFDFAHGIDRDYTYAYQVRRAEFDAALFANAADKGARTVQGVRVKDVVFGPPGGRAEVLAEGPPQGAFQGAAGRVRRYAPRFVIDASGRDTFLGAKLRSKRSNKQDSTAAVFGHFRGVACRSGDRAGYITIHLVPGGWFWMIPLPEGIMSVGFVGTQAAFRERRGSMHDFLLARIRESPTVAARMQGAEPATEVIATGNYAYRCRSAVGDGYFMIGDAFAFIDPIFSSGVLLAMTSAEMGAEVAHAWLDDPAAGRQLARRTERRVRQAMDALSWLIYRINHPVLRDMFMSPHNRLRMREGLVSLLAGNIHGQTGLRLPVLAFKGAFHMLRLAGLLGYRLHPDGTIRPAAAWAT